MKIYGPYKRRDGRSHIIVINDHGARYTQSYPRYLMEQHLNRRLEDWEEVDHINDDVSDNRIENLQLLTKAENIRKSIIPAELITFICPECGKKATKSAAIVRHNQGTYNRKGPYCSRNCAGRANARK